MQRKATKNTRGPNAEEKRFMAHSKECACIACGEDGPSIGHHAEGATFKNNKVLVGHWFILPLCLNCDDVITRGSRKAFRGLFGPQSELWIKHIENSPFEAPCEVFAAIESWRR